MYLKSLELIGFKSFAERTKLDFERGMTAIVGPNGCGKSNISDSVRWVLGEMSAKALRGGKMEDCIFNGTDYHKPLGMAEVTLTLADCEQALATEFHEITVTRRVFRTGEGEYFINKTPCRLKDIQRLFMDTGIGTNSYSVLEQGRIDQILSSRPEDRREVFEEASGITKFKADKKEAIRKLEHTEANLLRLADIIREVRRQIISLQRQAGKARRYKEIQEKLRGYDIYAARERLNLLNQEIATLETRLASIGEQEEAVRADVEQAEASSSGLRADLAATEKAISDSMESAVQAKNELDRARELIQINQDRIRELRDLSERDNKDAEEARSRLEEHRAALGQLAAELEQAVAARDAAERDLNEKTARLAALDAEMEQVRRLLHDLGAESVDLESRAARLQNEIHSLEAQERNTVIRRERLAAEQVELQRIVEIYATRQGEMTKGLDALRAEVDTAAERVKLLSGQRADKDRIVADVRDRMAELDARLAARRAQIELLQSAASRTGAYPGGARLLLDPATPLNVDRAKILGALAEQIRAEPDFRLALEAVLRSWLDAVVVTDAPSALALLDELQRQGKGSARLLALDAPAPGPFADGPGDRLLDRVQAPDALRPLVARLLHNVRVVDSLAAVPSPIAADAVYVTRGGALARGSGSFECWMPDAGEANPLAHQYRLGEWSEDLARMETERAEYSKTVMALVSEEHSVGDMLAQAQVQLDEARRKFAQREGEAHIITQEADQARERAETVAWEAGVLKEQQDSGGGRRTSIHTELDQIRAREAEIRSLMAGKNDALRALEHERAEKATEVSDGRVLFAERRQSAEHVTTRKEPLEARIRELEGLIQNRAEGIHTYQARIEDLQRSIAATEQKLQPLQAEMERHHHALEEARRGREGKMAELAGFDAALRDKRAALEEARRKRSQADVEIAEQRVRRQNLIERVAMDYHITAEQMAVEPDPPWEDGHKPDRDALETLVAELRAKLEAMGPVNLVAIEEHRELEERYTFLSQQQEDLVNAKQQLMELIRRINKTTTEMFHQTFLKVNENFQDMFKKLFGGGSAKLVLVNEEDVLESGIEIIARPPGKKLQTVSLLSGGERTMTAVALLFALYMVKPSPFCLLDELDAALDEANIGRFIRVVQGFLENSQFVVITHNRQTISAADVLYGVTMEQNGVSKIVSVKFSHHEKKPAPQELPPIPENQAVSEEELEAQPAAVVEPAAPEAAAAETPPAPAAAEPSPPPSPEPPPPVG